jgi:molybdate transport system ATP-binding protein
MNGATMTLTVDITKRFPEGPLIRAAFELGLGAFGITVIFGPSGCGKTTLLRVLSGLERPDEGHLRWNGETWFNGDRCMPPERRRVGHVFQDGALFPHLSVASNIGFGLSPGWPRPDRAARVAELVERVGLAGLENRRPGELSGGQKQRVALARALAPRPRLLLLDEPFASLDRPSAESLRHELRTLLRAEAIPAVLVTHDRGDALSLGDRLLRMDSGRIVQDGRPEDVLTGFSTDLDEGITETILRARVGGRREGLLCFEVGSILLFAPDPGGVFREARLCIRSEGVTLEHQTSNPGSPRNRLEAVIRDMECRGSLTRVHLDCGFPLVSLLTTWACKDLGLRVGDLVQAQVKATAIRVLPMDEQP